LGRVRTDLQRAGYAGAPAHGWGQRARALGVEQEAVVRAFDRVALHAAVAQIGPLVRAARVLDHDPVVQVAPEHQVHAQAAQARGLLLGDVRGNRDRVPQIRDHPSLLTGPPTRRRASSCGLALRPFLSLRLSPAVPGAALRPAMCRGPVRNRRQEPVDSATSTVPASPSTTIRSPVRMTWVACLVFTTDGTLNSRATIELCESIEPMSVTTPPAMANS